MFFLIEYDRTSQRLVRIQPFAAAERVRAHKARLDVELDLNRAGVDDRELVTLEAANEEDLRRTHRRYFEDLAGIASSFGRE